MTDASLQSVKFDKDWKYASTVEKPLTYSSHTATAVATVLTQSPVT